MYLSVKPRYVSTFPDRLPPWNIWAETDNAVTLFSVWWRQLKICLNCLVKTASYLYILNTKVPHIHTILAASGYTPYRHCWRHTYRLTRRAYIRPDVITTTVKSTRNSSCVWNNNPVTQVSSIKPEQNLLIISKWNKTQARHCSPHKAACVETEMIKLMLSLWHSTATFAASQTLQNIPVITACNALSRRLRIRAVTAEQAQRLLGTFWTCRAAVICRVCDVSVVTSDATCLTSAPWPPVTSRVWRHRGHWWRDVSDVSAAISDVTCFASARPPVKWHAWNQRGRRWSDVFDVNAATSDVTWLTSARPPMTQRVWRQRGRDWCDARSCERSCWKRPLFCVVVRIFAQITLVYCDVMRQRNVDMIVFRRRRLENNATSM